MKTTKVITVKKHLYAGVNREVGEIYQAEEKYVRLLTAMGLIRMADPHEQPGTYRRRDMRAQK